MESQKLLDVSSKTAFVEKYGKSSSKAVAETKQHDNKGSKGVRKGQTEVTSIPPPKGWANI